MSDFLTRLAQRSLGEAPAVRPRLPGLFAPLNEEATPASEAVVVDLHEPLPALAPAPLSRAPKAREETADATGTGPARAPAPAVAGERAGNAVPARKSEAQATQPSGDEGEAAASERSAREPLVRARPSAESGSSPVLLVEKAAPREQLPASPPVAQTRQRARAKESTADSAGQYLDREPAQAPAVHITIGRVEVRASIAAPPPPVRPRPEHKPALSLADYLRRGGAKP